MQRRAKFPITISVFGATKRVAFVIILSCMSPKRGGMFTCCLLPFTAYRMKRKAIIIITTRRSHSDNATRKKSNLKVPIGVFICVQQNFIRLRFFGLVRWTSLARLCLWDWNDVVVVGASNVFLSSLFLLRIPPLVSQHFPFTSLKLRLWWRYSKRDSLWTWGIHGDESHKCEVFYGNNFW